MYRLVSFSNGYACICDDAKPYNANHLAADEVAASALVNTLNAEYMLPQLASYRYQVETSGISVNGATILTDRGSQSQLNSALQALTAGFVTSVDWKGSNGWLSVTLAQIQPIGALVAQHVQRCFSAERTVATQIVAGTLTPEQVNSAFDSALAALIPAPTAV